MNKLTAGSYLITTDNWFIAPDGRSYKAVWGNVKILDDKILGITTNRNSSNWFIRLGTDNNHIIIAGCQIHYAIKCDNIPNIGNVLGWPEKKNNDEGFITPEEPTRIYIFKDLDSNTTQNKSKENQYDKIKELLSSNKVKLPFIEKEPVKWLDLPYSKCLHESCEDCKGTGVKNDGSKCVHNLFCLCSKCRVKYIVSINVSKDV